MKPAESFSVVKLHLSRTAESFLCDVWIGCSRISLCVSFYRVLGMWNQ